jgi:cytochrome c556
MNLRVRRNVKRVYKQSLRIVTLYPDTKASRKGAGSNATSAVWDKKEQFDALGQGLAQAAKRLSGVAATASMSDLKAGLRDLACTCKSCHKVFRKKNKAKH